MEISVLPAYKLRIILTSQYRVEDLEELLDMLDSDRRSLINRYQNDPGLSNNIIVVADGKIIDGNHRALAAALNKTSIKYVDLDELEEDGDY